MFMRSLGASLRSWRHAERSRFVGPTIVRMAQSGTWNAWQKAANQAASAGSAAAAQGAVALQAERLPQLPKAPELQLVRLGNEDWYQMRSRSGAPLYYTPAQLERLKAYIGMATATGPFALMLLGTLVSGKTTLLEEVLPGLLAAEHASPRWDSGRGRPVVLNYAFPEHEAAEDAARDLCIRLEEFAKQMDLPFESSREPGTALNKLPRQVQALAESVRGAGGELWLLLDELQAPIIASTQADARRFVARLKELIRKSLPNARIVFTGSGLISLLNSFRLTGAQDFVMWDAVKLLGMGSQPPVDVATSMATCMLESAKAASRTGSSLAVTPGAVVKALDVSSGDNFRNRLTSARPALLAFTITQLVGEAVFSRDGGMLLPAAMRVVESKLIDDSTPDAVKALVAMQPAERAVLRDVAAGEYTLGELRSIANCEPGAAFKHHRGWHRSSSRLAEFALSLCEHGDSGASSMQAFLQPPYSRNILHWVTSSGRLAVSYEDDLLRLDSTTYGSLVCFWQNRHAIRGQLLSDVSAAISRALLSNRIGYEPRDRPLRIPVDPDEFKQVPVLVELNEVLAADYAAGRDQHEPTLNRLVTTGELRHWGSLKFDQKLSLELLCAFRHYQAHVDTQQPEIVRNGITAAVVAETMAAAATSLVGGVHSPFCFSPVDRGRLMLRGAVPRQRPTRKPASAA